MRHLALLVVVACAAGPVAAAPSSLVEHTLSIQLSSRSTGPLPALDFPSGVAARTVLVSSGLGSFGLPPARFPGTGVLPSQLFTGVSLISSLNVGSVTVGALTFDGRAGTASNSARARLGFGVLGGVIDIGIPLVFGTGTATQLGAAALAVTVTAGNGWSTGAVRVTGISTATPGTAAVNTATLSGSDSRTAGHQGSMTLVTPTRLLSNIPGFNLPIFASRTLHFVPEPGAPWLLASALLALAGLRRRRAPHSRAG